MGRRLRILPKCTVCKQVHTKDIPYPFRYALRQHLHGAFTFDSVHMTPTRVYKKIRNTETISLAAGANTGRALLLKQTVKRLGDVSCKSCITHVCNSKATSTRHLRSSTWRFWLFPRQSPYSPTLQPPPGTHRKETNLALQAALFGC